MILAPLAVTALVAGQAANVSADGDSSRVPVFPTKFSTAVPQAITGDFSTLERGDEGLEAHARLVGLEPGSTVVVVFNVFNNPVACSGKFGLPGIARCGGPDTRNPATGFRTFEVTREVVRHNGRLNMEAEVSNPAVTNPAGAEIGIFFKNPCPTATNPARLCSFAFAVHQPAAAEEDREDG